MLDCTGLLISSGIRNVYSALPFAVHLNEEDEELRMVQLNSTVSLGHGSNCKMLCRLVSAGITLLDIEIVPEEDSKPKLLSLQKLDNYYLY